MRAKLSQEEFVRRLKEVHGNKYDYTNAVYIANNIKIKLICKKHGEFEINPVSIFKGCGCKKCAHALTGIKSRLTTEKFVKKAMKVHGNKYNYKLSKYEKHVKIIIFCNQCKKYFETTSSAHLSGRNCPKCAIKNRVYNYNYKVNHELFMNINSKEIAYILGLFWADGSIRCGNNKDKQIAITLLSEDMKEVENIFKYSGEWKILIDNRSKKERTRLYTYNKYLYQFLLENDYYEKSYKSADKILNKINYNLQKWFFRGVIDGDGCFYKSKNNRIKNFMLISAYDQDWTYFKNLLERLNINYKIHKKQHTDKNNKIQRCSRVEICNKDGIIKLGNYIYENFKKDKLGFNRKYLKFIAIKESYVR